MTHYAVLDESTRTEKGYYRHDPCGWLLVAKTVHHPVHHQEFEKMGVGAGSGEVRTEVVPYCKLCSTEPSSAGVVVCD